MCQNGNDAIRPVAVGRHVRKLTGFVDPIAGRNAGFRFRNRTRDWTGSLMYFWTKSCFENGTRELAFFQKKQMTQDLLLWWHLHCFQTTRRIAAPVCVITKDSATIDASASPLSGRSAAW